MNSEIFKRLLPGVSLRPIWGASASLRMHGNESQMREKGEHRRSKIWDLHPQFCMMWVETVGILTSGCLNLLKETDTHTHPNSMG